MLARGEKPIVDFDTIYGETSAELIAKIMEIVQNMLARPEVQAACIEEVKPITLEEIRAWTEQFEKDLRALPDDQVRGLMESVQCAVRTAIRRKESQPIEV